MAALIGKGSPLDWACCGSTCVAHNEQDSLESESRRAASYDDTKAGCSATIPRPPIVTSSADTLTLTRNSACSSTFRDDDEDELYDVIADLLGSSKLAADAANLGDRIVLSMGYNGGARSTAHKTEKKASHPTASKSTASSSSHASPTKDGAGDNTSPRRSAGQSHIPYWIGMDEKKNEPKLQKVAAKETFAKINKSLKKPLKASLCKWIKKTKRAPPSDISTASSAFSSLGFYSAWAE